MGANTHLQQVFQKGYKVAGSATDSCIQLIEPLPGYRVAVTGFAYTTTGVGSKVNFCQVVGRGTVGATNIASGAAAMLLSSSSLFAAYTFASGAYIVVALQNGKYQALEGTNASSMYVTLNTILQASVVAGASVWMFPKLDAADNCLYTVTAITQKVETSYGGPGLFYGTSKGDPLLVVAQTTAAASIDYVTGGYITA